MLIPALLTVVLLLSAIVPLCAAPAIHTSTATDVCQMVELQGEVASGQQWKQSIGRGFDFMVLPITPAGSGYTGWDLVVSADGAYPDALLLATPPYASLSEREIGTTYGLRAQDAIAWTPRHFHFLLKAEDIQRARSLYHSLMNSRTTDIARQRRSSELLALVGSSNHVAAGQFTILDTQFTSGTADPPTFATDWAANLRRVPHTVVPGAPTPRGALLSIRFQVTLWLPSGWQLSPKLHGKLTRCTE